MSISVNNTADPKIVTHFIAGYPTYQASLDVARGLIAGGAFALEMQIPFSDPNADGPVIEGACREALDAGFKVADTWSLLREIRAESDIPVFVMSYASLVFTPGVEIFVQRAVEAGASGFIIPDLVPGADEGLYAAAAAAGCHSIPVVVPWITDKRLEEVLSEPIEWIYVALRSGITGTYTELGADQEAFLSKLRKCREVPGSGTPGGSNAGGGTPGGSTQGGPKIMAGFGIQDAAQVAAVTAMADAAIVGSALVRVIADAGAARAGDAVKKLVEKLKGIR